MAKRRQSDTTVPPLPGGFEKALKALLGTPPHLGRPTQKKQRKSLKKR